MFLSVIPNTGEKPLDPGILMLIGAVAVILLGSLLYPVIVKKMKGKNKNNNKDRNDDKK